MQRIAKAGGIGLQGGNVGLADFQQTGIFGQGGGKMVEKIGFAGIVSGQVVGSGHKFQFLMIRYCFRGDVWCSMGI